MKAFINFFRGQNQEPKPEPAKVLIVAKTHVKSFACVGALNIADNRSLRLMQPNAFNQPGDTEFEVGQIWELDYTLRPDVKPPHVEDVLVHKQKLVGEQPDLRAFLLALIEPWQGHPKNTFECLARPTYEGSGYVNEIMGAPSRSTGYWLPDKPLTLTHNSEGKAYYEYPRTLNPRDRHKHEIHRLPYVGYAPPVERIPVGALVRVSLARWWKHEESEVESRCYVQLSGWYP